MAHNSYLKPGGIWPLFTLLTSGIMASVDALLYKALNADDGGTWAPAAVITIGGSGLTVTGPFTASNASITVGSGKTLTIASGGTFITAVGSTTTLNGDGTLSGGLDVDGNITIVSSGYIRVESGAAFDMYGGMDVTGTVTFRNGSLSTYEAGSTVIAEGDFYFSNSTWPKLSPARAWKRRSLTIAVTTGVTRTDPSAPDGWKVVPPGGGGATSDRIVTRSTTAGSDYTVVEFFDIPNGGTFVQAEVECIGAEPGTVGMSFPSFQLIRWKGTTVELMSALIADTHVLANWDTTPITTTITATAHQTVDSEYRYGVVVYHAYYGGSPAGSGYITDCIASGTVAAIKL